VTLLRCSLPVLFANLSRVTAPNLTAAPAAALEDQVVVALARNAIAAARSVTLRVRAPRRPEAAVQEATAVAGEEATVVLGAGAAGAVKKHGALSRVVFCRITRGTKYFLFSVFLKLHLWWSRPSIA
jgi:hypothetical protein